MKKISNTIRIGVVRREDIPSKLNEDQSAPSNVQEQSGTQDNHDLQHLPRITSPNHVRIHDINEAHTNKQKQQTHDMHSQLSISSVHPEQQTVDDLYGIPTKTKGLTRKKVLVGLTIAAVVCVVIIVATVLAVMLTTSGNTTTTSSSTSSTTTIAPTIISAYWSFDNISTDLYGVYNGNITNGATFSPAGSFTVPYVGYGQALLLNGASNQQFYVPTPFLSLNSTSFTIEAWIYSTTLIGDRGIFGQCQCSTCTNQCFFFICRNNHLYVGFTLNDLSGTITMAVNTWYHVAFVYNYQTQQQILYLNGVQDSINSNVPAYQGRNGSIQIGSTEVYSATNYFSGYIDNVLVTTQAKSSSQILSDASVVVYYSFDLPNINTDSSANHLNGTSNNTVTTSGRVNQAMRFVGLWSIFQMYGLYQVPYGVINNKPFSVSMWINPTSINSCTMVQMFATSLSTGSCADLLGIYSPGGTIGQLFVMSSYNSPSLITGPFVTQNAWSHVSLTYSPTDGYTLYYNGVYFGATGNMTYTQSNTFAFLFIGYSTTCNLASVNLAYQGSIDEFYIHSRELTQSDVTSLANA